MRRARGIYRPGAGDLRARPRAAGHGRSTSAPTSRCGPSTSSSSPSWAPRSRSGPRRGAPARRAALDRRGGHEGHAAHRGGPRALRDRLAGAAASSSSATSRATRSTAGEADVVVTDGFTGNVALKLMEGVSETMLRAIRDVATSSARAKLGGLLLRPALLEFREALDPESAGRRLPARPARARRRLPRAVLAARHRPGDPAGRARRARGRRRADRTPPSRPRARCAARRRPAETRPRPHIALACRRHDPRRGVRADPDAPGRRARHRSGAHRRGDALQGGPRGRLARPLHARPGARGLLRRPDLRRARPSGSTPSARRSTSSSTHVAANPAP